MARNMNIREITQFVLLAWIISIIFLLIIYIIIDELDEFFKGMLLSSCILFALYIMAIVKEWYKRRNK